jgi:hypothetical protein
MTSQQSNRSARMQRRATALILLQLGASSLLACQRQLPVVDAEPQRAASGMGSAGSSASSNTNNNDDAALAAADAKCLHQAELDYVVTPRAGSSSVFRSNLQLLDGTLYYNIEMDIYAVPIAGGDPSIAFSAVADNDVLRGFSALGGFLVRAKDILFWDSDSAGRAVSIYSVSRDSAVVTTLGKLHGGFGATHEPTVAGQILSVIGGTDFYSYDPVSGTELTLDPISTDKQPMYTTDEGVLIRDDTYGASPGFLVSPLAGGASNRALVPAGELAGLVGAAAGYVYYAALTRDNHSNTIWITKRLPFAGGDSESLGPVADGVGGGAVASDLGVALWQSASAHGSPVQLAWIPAGSSTLSIVTCISKDIEFERAVLDGNVLYSLVAVEKQLAITRQTLQ